MSLHYILAQDAIKVLFFVSDLPNSSERIDPEFNPTRNIQHTCTFRPSSVMNDCGLPCSMDTPALDSKYIHLYL